MVKAAGDFFFVNRSLLKSDRWLAEKFTQAQAWVDMIGLAQHTDGFFIVRGIKVDVKRGDLGYSQLTLANRWRWSRNKVRRFLNALEKDGDLIQQNTPVTTIITLLNYNYFQGGTQENDTTSETTERQQKDNRRNTYNKDNKENNENKQIKQLTPIQALVTKFKELKGIPPDDKMWDKTFWPRNSASAKKLLEYLVLQSEAEQCMVDISTEMKSKNLEWMFETIVKHADRWKMDRLKKANEDIRRKEEMEAVKRFVTGDR